MIYVVQSIEHTSKLQSMLIHQVQLFSFDSSCQYIVPSQYTLNCMMKIHLLKKLTKLTNFYESERKCEEFHLHKKYFKENCQGVYLACQTLNHQVMHSFNLSYVLLIGNYLVSASMILLLYCQTAMSPSSRAHNALSSSHAIWFKLENSQIEENQFQKHQISNLIYTYLKFTREGEES